MDAGEYTYLRLQTKTGETWAAVPKSTVKKGSDVSIANPMNMTGFQSKILKRKFDRIVFGTLEGDSAQGYAQPADVAAHHVKSPSSADLRPESVKVTKAEGPDARRIAEIFSQKAELKGKTVLVRGKVVKLTRGVLGKNWIHIRDGSGDDSSHNNDITLTTQTTVAMGDVVLAKGTVALDKNIGSGYFFAVMIEDATLTK